MPFAFSQYDPPTGGNVSQWNIPFNEWISHKFSDSYGTTFGNKVSEITQEHIADGTTISPQLANKLFGIPGYLSFDKPISNQVAALRSQRKRAQLDSLAMAESDSESWASWKGVAGTFAGIAGGLAHPVDFALTSLPFVGSLTAVGKLGTPVLESALYRARAALARGLITTEQLSAYTRFPALGASMINATAGISAIEMGKLAGEYLNGDNPDTAEALQQVAMAPLVGATLHGVTAGAGFLLKRAAKAFGYMSPEARAQVIHEEMTAMAEGRRPDIQGIVSTDESTVLNKVKFDEQVARAEAIKEFDSRITDEKALARARLEQDYSLGGARKEDIMKVAADAIPNMTGKQATEATELINKINSGKADHWTYDSLASLVGLHYDESAGPLSEGFSKDVSKAAEPRQGVDVSETSKQAEGRHLILMEAEEKLRWANELKTASPEDKAVITKELASIDGRIEKLKQDYGLTETTSSPEQAARIQEEYKARFERKMNQTLASERKKAIEAYVERKRQEFESDRLGNQPSERDASISAQQGQGNILPREMVEKYRVAEVPSDAEIAQVEKDSQTLTEDIKRIAGDEEKAAALLKAAAELEPKDVTPAIDAAIECAVELASE